MPIDSEAVFGLIAAGAPPELGPERRQGTESATLLNRRVDSVLATGQLPKGNAQLVRALVLLWHDHLEDAHVLAQDVEGADGAFVHGIMHRREPDYGNAAYWFRRVGKHPAFREIGKRVADLPDLVEFKDIQPTLLPPSGFDPFAFINLCEKHARGPKGENTFLRDIQAIETKVLLERLL